MGRRLPRRLSRSVLWLWLCLAPAAALLAQTTGKIEGRITDASGGVLPGVAIEAVSSSQQAIRTTTSARDGVYRLLAIPPGTYRVRARLESFRDAEKAATVQLDATVTVDLVLQLASTEKVVVSAAAPLVDTTSTTTGTNYPARVIASLPVARNYADIVRSNPGVATDHGVTQGRSLTLTVYGATSAENLWIIDGVNTTNVQVGIQGKAINAEFVQEVEVKTGGYQAEYGRALGGVINVITRSGGNQFHGDGFLYYDSAALAARQVSTTEDSSLVNMRIADYRRKDFGADLGGFLVKDRLWFFAAYDRVAADAEVSPWKSNDHVSTSDRFPLNSHDNLYSGKLTWNLSSSTTMVGTVFGDPTIVAGASGADPRQGVGAFQVPPIVNPDPDTWWSERRIGGVDYSVRASAIFGPNALLTGQGARHQDRYALSAPQGFRTNYFLCDGGTLTQPCAPPQTSTFATGGFGFIWGASNSSESRRDQYRADLSVYAGDHELRFGGDYQYSRTDATSSFTGGQSVQLRNERGVTYYRHNFFAAGLNDPTPLESNHDRARHQEHSLYLQDSWKPAAGWTVNLGLRWDDERVFGYGDTTAFHLNSEWQPRVGVVWDPWANGATKVYASAGRFYYSLPTNLALLVYGRNYFTQTFNFDPVSTVQDPSVPHHESANGPYGSTPENVDAGLKGIYQDEYSIGIERLLGPGFSVGLKATYRRLGNVIEDRCDLDYNAPVTNGNQCALVNPGSDGAMARGAIPGCFDVYNGVDCSDTVAAQPPARRVYRGIELLVRKSVADRLWLQASYVYSSLRGNYDGEVSNGYYGQTNPAINVDFDYAAFNHNGYGRLFLDRPHRLRLDGYWITPLGLSLGLQAYYASGAPLNRIGYFNDYWGSEIQLDPKGYAGRMPAQWEANLTLSYPISIGPVTVTPQLYVFNVFNRQTPTYRDTVWSLVPPPGYDQDERAAVFDSNQPKSNDTYGKVTERLPPRSIRAAVKISF